MTNSLVEHVLARFKLNEKQRSAALERGRDVAVTAGAGSGKTSTLAARYACLLAEGVPPRRIAAVTFTKKAAREMRSRVRARLAELQQAAEGEEERQLWLDLSSQMDSARIGTIHSLCTEILRAHPAEAGVDPRFEVLDEGVSAALRVQAVDDTLNVLVQQERFMPLLMSFSTGSLTEMLQHLLARRLEAAETFAIELDNRARLARELAERMNHPLLGGLVHELAGMPERSLAADAGDTLAGMVKELLSLWAEAENALAAGDTTGCAVRLFRIRRDLFTRRGGKDGEVKAAFKSIKENFDILLDPFVGGKDSKDSPPSPEAEALFEQLQPLLREAFDEVNRAYQELVEGRQALDFDDLEFGARQLLRQPEIRERWEAELDAVLVDEFQDTNQRQREIVRALAGAPGRLFIVGDMRQSIYRFRRADVTVFGEELERIRGEGGLVVDLDRTYRAHEPLLLATGDLLAGVIGTEPDPSRKYYVPYTPLVADRKEAPEGTRPPYVEFVLGAGSDAEAARPAAARALIMRLLQLRDEGQIKKWDEVALLFRASTTFPVYEQALEEAGIPFVTVAGRGFYDRPEVRDLVNILRALADPLDDLSFAGLLRSPAFGLSDAALFLLRQAGQPFWTALQGDLTGLNDQDRRRAGRALQILSTLLPRVDRVPVAELLEAVVDAVDYRAVLAAADIQTGEQGAGAAGGRLWRNLDKLLEDARAGQQVNVRVYLDALKTLNDAGAREGEAPAEAEGAVSLMTIHKAKGLEYGVVVLANAGGLVRATGEQVYLSNELGATFKLDPTPMLYGLAKALDKDQEEAEALRLLYVALTRAKGRLIISAHAATNEEGRFRLDAWAKDLVKAAGLQVEDFLNAAGEPFEARTSSGQPLRAWCPAGDLPLPGAGDLAAGQGAAPASGLKPLYAPVEELIEAEAEETDEEAEVLQPWRAAWQGSDVPGNVLGSMVHRAIQRWLFPGDPRLVPLLEAEAFNAGLAYEQQRENAVRRAVELLERLRRHPLWEEIEAAPERRAELPYSYRVNGRTENRFIDLLYRTERGWQIVDFKTDPVQTAARKEELVREYTPQLQRYRAAVKTLLGVDAAARICFLDDRGRVEVE